MRQTQFAGLTTAEVSVAETTAVDEQERLDAAEKAKKAHGTAAAQTPARLQTHGSSSKASVISAQFSKAVCFRTITNF